MIPSRIETATFRLVAQCLNQLRYCVPQMRFLRSVKGYTRLDKIRSEVVRKELEISGIQDVRPKHKQNWINHLVRWTPPDFRNTPSATNLEEEEIVDALGNDGNTSMPEHVNRPNPWRKMMMINKMLYSISTQLQYVSFLATCFGFYKTIFRPMLATGRYSQCVHTLWDPIVFT